MVVIAEKEDLKFIPQKIQVECDTYKMKINLKEDKRCMDRR